MSTADELAWQADASCRSDPESFFNDRRDSKNNRMAKKVCGRCVVLEQCKNWVMNLPYSTGGIIAAMTEDERAARGASTAEYHWLDESLALA